MDSPRRGVHPMNPQKKNSRKSLNSNNRQNVPTQRSASRNSKRNNRQVVIAGPRQTYTTAPVAFANKQQFSNRRLTSTNRRIKHSELISSVYGSVGYGVTSYSLNPGIGVFPWLSTQAASWQQYRFHSLQFRYVTRSATSAVGSVILSPEYNPDEPIPLSELTASNTMDAVEDVTWRELLCRLTPSAMFPVGPRKYLRIAAVPGELGTYDAGRMNVCTIGQADGSMIGKLWADYDVELFVPQTSPATVDNLSPVNASMFGISSNYTTSEAGAFMPFDLKIYNPLHISVDGVHFTPPAGSYLITYTASFYAVGVDEVVVCSLIFHKNGVILPRSIFSGARSIAGTVGTDDLIVPVTISGIIPFNGTDTFELWVSMESTGTSIVGTGGMMVWQVV